MDRGFNSWDFGIQLEPFGRRSRIVAGAKSADNHPILWPVLTA